MKIKPKLKSDYNKILIIEVNWLGDVLFSTPCIKAIRNKFENAYIACMTVPRTKAMLEYNKRIDEIIIYDEKGKHKNLFGKIRLISELNRKKFDLAIILHRSFTRALITFLSGIGERVGYSTKGRGVLLTYPIEAPEENLHKVEYFLKIAESIGCETQDKDYEFFITEKERKYIEKELAKNNIHKDDFLVVINPGGNWEPKRWSEERFAELGDALIAGYGVKIVLSGAENDIEKTKRIKNRMKGELTILAGRTSLKELGALLERANIVISNDSGPMHIAVAMKSNVIALFGPTSAALTGPYGRGNYRVIQKDVECEIPCYNLECGDYRCMEAITVDDVLKVFSRLYSSVKENIISEENR